MDSVAPDRARGARRWRAGAAFNGEGTFPTRAEAVAACVQPGRDIIDGKESGRAVLF